MYTKLDLEENKKMSEILKQNQIKMRKLNEKRAKREKLLNAVLCVSVGIFFIGLMVLISAIENVRF